MFRGSIIEKLQMVDFLFKLNGFQVIEFRLMTLNFCEVSVVEVAGVLERSTVPKYYHTPGSVTDCKEISTAIEANCS